MPESSTITTQVQIGRETVHGTAVPADKKLLGVSIGQFLPNVETDTFVPMGYKFATLVSPNAEWSQAGITGRPDYNGLLYPLAGICGVPTSSEIMESSTNTGAFQHEFEVSSTSADDVPTFTVEQGNGSYAQKVAYALMTAFNLSFPRRGTPSLGGTMVGQLLQDGITLTADPDELPPVPILGSQIDVFMDNTAAALGTTKLLRAFQYDWAFGDRQGQVWALNSAITSFAAHYETMPSATVSMQFANDATGRALLPKLRAGESKFVRFLAKGPRIYDGTVDQFYTLQIDVCLKVNAGYSEADQNGLSVLTWPFTISHDATWGKAMYVKLINTVDTL